MEKKLGLRARFNFYETLEASLAYQEHSKFLTSLAGTWDFLFCSSIQATPAAFLEGKYDQLEWQTIEVPGNFEFQGYGTPIYANIDYPFALVPPRVPFENPTGLYHLSFEYHKKLDGQQILRFDGVESAFEVWLNGRFLGESQGSRLMTEFAISELLKEGKNELALRVVKWSKGSYMEDQDMWWLAGVTRDITIIEESEIQSIKVTPKLEQEQWTVEIKLKRAHQKRLEFGVFNEGEVVCDFRSVSEDATFAALKIQQPKLWNYETPNLYTLVARIDGTVYLPIRFGLRRIEKINQILCLNSEPILFNGVNRHEFHCQKGRALTKEYMKEELIQIKRAHINAIRTAHYPNHPYFYDLCDELGFMVIDECDIETHGFPEQASLCQDPLWEEAFCSRGLRMVSRDYHHPSILLWSLGNESHFGINFVKMAEKIRAYDSTRLIHYEGDRECQVVDVYSTMYSSIDELKARASKKISQMPHILCEYGHAMGNGPGSLKEYQEVFEQYDSVQGGFIWEWKDHGILVEDGTQTSYKIGGDFGEYVHDGDFVIDGLVLPDNRPSPALFEYTKIIQPVEFFYHGNQLVLRNKYKYKQLTGVKLVWEFQNKEQTVVGEISSISPIDPGTLSEVLSIPAPAEVNGVISFRLIPLEPVGVFQPEDIFASEQFEYEASYQKPGRTETSLEKTIQYTQSDSFIQVTMEETTVTINLHTGNISSFVKQGTELLNAEMNLSLHRQQISNDAEIQKIWNESYLRELFSYCRKFAISKNQTTVFLLIDQYIAPPQAPWGMYVKNKLWLLDGKLTRDCEIWFDGQAPSEVPRIGWELPFQNKVAQVSWYGRGPGESYPDSHYSSHIGQYQLDAKDWAFPYVVPQETGNRMAVEQAKLLFEDTELELVCARPLNMNLVPMTANQNMNYRFKQPEDPLQRVLRIDGGMRGLGSHSCGPKPLDKYLLKSEYHSMKFTLA
ncbi:evolved beta-galactosidase subunit alpha [Enterococcus sp. AZ194]|uniref:glycoside hydrolase family 2 TIM barrel-domain containing protein n=1 Tax=Enterococcus sp. AZ194 TaxID=2774629 RepID=UPI003F28739D